MMVSEAPPAQTSGVRTVFGALRRVGAFFRASPRASVGLLILGIIAAVSIFAPLIAPYNPTTMNIDAALQPPTLAHPFGTDDFGRDIFSRTLYGGRPSLAIGGATVLIALLIGLPFGVLAGYFGGYTDMLISRVAELAFSLPAMVLAIGIIAFVGTGAQNVVIALSIIFAPLIARVVRASTLEVKGRPFIQAANAVGDTDVSIMIRQIIPNIMAPVLVQSALAFAYALLAEASLSFLGLGTQPPLSSWGRMLTDAMNLIQQAPWTGIFPGLFILLSVISLNLMADGLRDLFDPTLRLSRGEE